MPVCVRQTDEIIITIFPSTVLSQGNICTGKDSAHGRYIHETTTTLYNIV